MPAIILKILETIVLINELLQQKRTEMSLLVREEALSKWTLNEPCSIPRLHPDYTLIYVGTFNLSIFLVFVCKHVGFSSVLYFLDLNKLIFWNSTFNNNLKDDFLLYSFLLMSLVGTSIAIALVLFVFNQMVCSLVVSPAIRCCSFQIRIRDTCDILNI